MWVVLRLLSSRFGVDSLHQVPQKVHVELSVGLAWARSCEIRGSVVEGKYSLRVALLSIKLALNLIDRKSVRKQGRQKLLVLLFVCRVHLSGRLASIVIVQRNGIGLPRLSQRS